MLSLYRLVSFVFVLVSLFHQQVRCEEKLAVDVVLEDGQHVQFPFFDASIKEIAPEMTELLNENIKEFLEYLTPVVTNELDHPGSSGFMTWMKVTKNFISMGYRQKASRTKLNKPFPRESDFNKGMSKMFSRFMAESKTRAATIPDEPKQQLKQRVERYMSALQNGLAASPVSLYVDMANGKLNGAPFEEATVDMMALLRNNGFESFLGAVDKLMNLIAMLK